MSVQTELEECDSGKFETIATAILRRSNPLYERAIQTGINAEQKPIPDPVDGLACVQDRDSLHYVLFEYTTTQRNHLDSKWLTDPDAGSSTTEGDLPKAIDWAETIWEENPDARFTVVLVSNRTPDSDVIQRAEEMASEAGVELDVWNVHRLAEFLKIDREGQAIRKEYFGTMEDRLSESLLMELSKDSHRGYEDEFRVRQTDCLIEREEAPEIRETVQGSQTNHLIPLIAESGFGKTVTSYQMMEWWIKQGNPALRLIPEHIEYAQGLSEVLNRALTQLHPTLDELAGKDALRIAKETSQLLLVVDDLNRGDDTPRLVSKLKNWVGGTQSGGVSRTDGVPVVVLCPLWPRVWNRIERESENSKFIEPIKLGPFSNESATTLIQSLAEAHGVTIHEREASNLASQVGNDPHVIGLLGELMASNDEDTQLPDASRDVIQEYVEYAYSTASSRPSSRFSPPDYDCAMNELSDSVLEYREFEPLWSAVRDWVDIREDLEAIRDLADQTQLLSQIKREGDWRLSYRHDRLREFLLARLTINIVQAGDSPAYLEEPFYYSVFGTGIAYFQPSEEVLDTFRSNNPLALVAALQELGGGSPQYEDRVANQVQRWIADESGFSELRDSVKNELLDILVETDSPFVLDITESFPVFPQVLLARFRNGDNFAGIEYCNLGRIGSPSTSNSTRDSVFSTVFQEWDDDDVVELTTALSSIDDFDIEGALRLAGFYGDTALMTGIEDAWEKFGDTDRLLSSFIWAVYQCGIPGHTEMLDKVFQRWSELPAHDQDAEDPPDEVTKRDVYLEVKFSLTRDVTSEQARYLVDVVETYPQLEWKLLYLLYQIPYPVALECVVRKIAEYERDIDGDGFLHLKSEVSRAWQPDNPRGQSLPRDCMATLRGLWQDNTEQEKVRKNAFLVWSRSAKRDELDLLKEASDIDFFKDSAYRRRLQLGDESVLQADGFDLAENLTFITQLENVWGGEALYRVAALYRGLNENESQNISYELSRLLYRIPDQDAEYLLVSHFEQIRENARFFQAALYTATDRTKELAAETYAEVENPDQLFEMINMNYGFTEYGRSELISRESLLSLEPYLEHIGERSLVDIAHKAKELGMEDWSKKHVQPQLSGDQRLWGHPTDEDLFERLDELVTEEETAPNVSLWISGFDRKAEPLSRAFNVLRDWLHDSTSLERYRFCALAIRGWGSREHLSILENVQIEGADDRVHDLYQDAKFGVFVRTL